MKERIGGAREKMRRDEIAEKRENEKKAKERLKVRQTAQNKILRKERMKKIREEQKRSLTVPKTAVFQLMEVTKESFVLKNAHVDLKQVSWIIWNRHKTQNGQVLFSVFTFFHCFSSAPLSVVLSFAFFSSRLKICHLF